MDSISSPIFPNQPRAPSQEGPVSQAAEETKACDNPSKQTGECRQR